MSSATANADESPSSRLAKPRHLSGANMTILESIKHNQELEPIGCVVIVQSLDRKVVGDCIA